MSVAAAVGGRSVRVNVYTGVRVTDQGVVEGRARRVQRLRRLLAPRVRVWADVQVKPSSALGEPRALAAEVAEAVGRGGAAGGHDVGDRS